jgi:hypothetical protein
MAYAGPALPTIQFDEPEIAAFALPQPTPGVVGIQPLMTYSGNTPIYLSAADAGGNADTWYQFPTQTGNIQFIDASGNHNLQSAEGDLTFDGDSTLAKNFYIYPVADGNLNFTDSGNGQAYPLESVNGNLYFDGELLAKAGDIQDIAAWADYPAINNVDMNTNKINNAGDINCVDIECRDVFSGGDITAAAEMFCSHMNIIEPGTQLGDVPATTTEIFEGVITNGSDIINQGDISTNTIHVATIATTQQLNLDASGNPCALTTNAAGTALFVNGVQVQTGTPADVTQWATFPAVANVDVAANGLSMTGSLVPPATNKFGLGTALAPIGINDQYAINTNIYNISPVGTFNISSNSSMAILTTSTTGTNEMNITLAGAAGEDMNLTAPDINLTMTDPGSFMNLTAPFGVTILGGGGFFMAAGAMEVVTGLDIRLITTGNISIGSGNVLGATTQVEKFEFLDEFLSPMNGVNHLRLKNIEVINTPKDAGGDGYFPGTFNVAAAISSTTTLTSVNTSSEKMLFQTQVDQGGSVYKSMNLISQGTGGVNFSMSAVTGTKMNMGYDGNTLTIDRPTSITANMGSSSITTGQISATGNISTPLDISGGTMHTGTLTATVDVSGASGHFGPLYTSDTKIHLGSDAGLGQGAGAVAIGTEAGTSAQGANAVAIGFTAGSLSQEFGGVAVGNEAAFAGQRSNAVAVGTYAGRVSQGTASVAIGLEAGYTTQGANSVAVGWEAGQETQGANSVAVGVDAGFDTQGTGCVAVGAAAGSVSQGNASVCVGQNAGYSSIGANSVAVGVGAAGANSGTYVTAIGYGAGQAALGSNSVAIGAFSSTNGGSFANTIVINATGAILDPSGANSFYVNPIADLSGGIGFNMLGHQSATGEIRRGTATLTQAQNTISNTQQISYDTGLLTTTIAGISQLQTVKADGPVTIGTPAALSTLTVAGTIAIQDASGNTATQVVAQPQYVYYVSKNGRVGATGAITDPLSTITAALAKTANVSPVDAPGMTIYVGVGSYAEDISINIAPATLPSVSIIGLGDDTDDSKRVQLRGAITINATDASLVNTVNTVVFNNLAVFAKDVSSSAITMSGRGYRVYLKNGLYTTPYTPAVPLIALSSTVTIANSVVQLVIDNCSMSMTGGAGHMISMTSGQLFEIQNSDLTHRGTGLAVNMSGGAFSVANQSAFNTTGAVLNIVQTAAGLTNVTNCLISGRASTTVALITLGLNANLNLTDSTVQNLNTTEANNTSRYVYTTSATGNFIAAIRNNITNSASPATVQQITPWQAAVPAASQLLYFGNIYSNQTATLVGVLPAQGGVNWNAVRQFNTDTYTQQLQVIATSGTAIVLTPTARGKTFILTGTTTQAFSTAGFGLADAGFFVMVHNGNATGGGDINITGATGTTIIHNRTATQNGGILYLYWTGAGLVGY